MQIKVILFLAIGLVSCKHDRQMVKIFKANNFIIADSSIEPNKYLKFDNYYIDYPIYFIGKISDTITIGKPYRIGRTNWPVDYYGPWSKTYSPNTLSIFVDTSIKTNSSVEYHYDETDATRFSTVNYHAFTFIIKNISESVIYIGSTFSVFFINREARDRTGNWVKVDNKLSELGICGTGQPTINLMPGEIAISKVKRYHGSFLTDFRLVFGHGNNIVYSNIFRDSIDERTLHH